MGAPDDGTTRARIVGEVCARISAGESVRAIFKTPSDHWPSEVTFWRWLHADADLNAAYESATAKRGERYAEEITDIADHIGSPLINEETGEPVRNKHGDVLLVVDKVAVDHARLRIDARKWVAARMLPKRYGDKVTLAGDADNPLAIVDHSAIAGRLLPELAAAGAAAPTREPDAD